MTMYHYKIESQLSAVRGDVVFIGVALLGALLFNAFLLTHIANELHCLTEIEKEKLNSPSAPPENEITNTTETATEQATAATVQNTAIQTNNENAKQ